MLQMVFIILLLIIERLQPIYTQELAELKIKIEN